MYQFNSVLENKVQMLNFPGSSSEQMLHYIDKHLEDKSISNVIFHISLNDLSN